MKIIDFTDRWIPAAMELAAANYREERCAVPVLPEMPALPPMDYLAENDLGVAAVQDGQLLGYLCAMGPWGPVFTTPSAMGVFSPLHAHAAVLEDRIRIYQRMYQAAAEKWVHVGAVSHAIMLYAHDQASQEALFYYGFGMRCMDLIRETISEPFAVSDCNFRELPPAEHSKLRHLRRALSEHLKRSPCFMADPPVLTDQWISRKELHPPRVFVAEHSGNIVAYLEVQGEGENFISCARGTANICGAYCMLEFRGNGNMQGLLNYMQTVLQPKGYTRLGVDCESFNPTALHFWRKHFTEYTHSLVRRIDENILRY